MKTDDIIKKIQKLLALAGNNPNEHERNAAMAKAKELLSAHNLSKAEVQGKTFFQAEMLEYDFAVYSVWERAIWLAVSRLCYVTCLFNTSKTRQDRPVLIGTLENLQTSAALCSWLVKAVRRETNKRCPDAPSKRSFATGAALAIRHSVLVLKNKETAAKNPASSTGTSLMVIRNEFERVNEEFVTSLGVKQAQSRPTKEIEENWARQGFRFGESLRIDHKGPKKLEAR